MLLVVQRGHVPRQTGATGAPGEQQFARETASRVQHHVGALGHQVRVINADEPLDRYRGDAFVAIHYDSGASSARGASVGYRNDQGKAFAQRWKAHYERMGWTGGFRDDNYTDALRGYYGVRKAVEAGNTIAFISEAGFHSNHLDAALLSSPGGPDRVARAIAAAVKDMWGGTTPEDEMTPAQEKAIHDKLDELTKDLGTLRRHEAEHHLANRKRLIEVEKKLDIEIAEDDATEG